MEKTQAEAAAEAALSASARAAEQESTHTDDKDGDHQDTDVQEPAVAEASGPDASSGGDTERQRRLESFELLDAAMDNVVDDDGSESADGQQESKEASEQQQDVGADSGGSQPVEAEQDIVVTEVQQVVPNVNSSAGHKVDVVEAQDAVVDEVSDMGHEPAAQALALADGVGNAHPVELTFVGAQRAPVEMNAMEENTRDATDQSVPMEPVSATSSEHIVAASELPITHGLVSGFEKYEPELLQWMQECQRNNHGLPASHDDVLFFMETKYPEFLENVAGLFEWLTQFLAIYNQMLATRSSGITDMVDPEITLVQQFDRFSDEFKLSAIQQLEETGDLTTVANEFGLKSTTTLVYWKYLRDNNGQLPASKGEEATEQGRRPSFSQEQHLLEWVLSHRETPITKQDIFSHMISAYPEFAVTKTAAALKMWITRFLKRHLSPGITASKDLMSALPVVEGLGIESESDLPDNAVASGLQDSIAAVGVSQVPTSKPPATASIPPTPVPQTKRREKRGCPDGYVLHSNEFKLNALRKLDEGKTISEVTEELGLKSQNTLAYWNSIRDKLATSEKKRFRLAGGGRRSSCTFEDELLSWVTERHQKGEGTDVKAVLDYMREFHPAFTDGKKEPTLRKWILRFFKRCLRTPSTTSGSGDVEKSCIFV